MMLVVLNEISQRIGYRLQLFKQDSISQSACSMNVSESQGHGCTQYANLIQLLNNSDLFDALLGGTAGICFSC